MFRCWSRIKVKGNEKIELDNNTRHGHDNIEAHIPNSLVLGHNIGDAGVEGELANIVEREVLVNGEDRTLRHRHHETIVDRENEIRTMATTSGHGRLVKEKATQVECFDSKYNNHVLLDVHQGTNLRVAIKRAEDRRW